MAFAQIILPAEEMYEAIDLAENKDDIMAAVEKTKSFQPVLWEGQEKITDTSTYILDVSGCSDKMRGIQFVFSSTANVAWMYAGTFIAYETIKKNSGSQFYLLAGSNNVARATIEYNTSEGKIAITSTQSQSTSYYLKQIIAV